MIGIVSTFITFYVASLSRHPALDLYRRYNENHRNPNCFILHNMACTSRSRSWFFLLPCRLPRNLGSLHHFAVNRQSKANSAQRPVAQSSPLGVIALCTIFIIYFVVICVRVLLANLDAFPELSSLSRIRQPYCRTSPLNRFSDSLVSSTHPARAQRLVPQEHQVCVELLNRPKPYLKSATHYRMQDTRVPSANISSCMLGKSCLLSLLLV